MMDNEQEATNKPGDFVPAVNPEDLKAETGEKSESQKQLEGLHSGLLEKLKKAATELPEELKDRAVVLTSGGVAQLLPQTEQFDFDDSYDIDPPILLIDRDKAGEETHYTITHSGHRGRDEGYTMRKQVIIYNRKFEDGEVDALAKKFEPESVEEY